MTADPLFQAVLFGSFIALGIGIEHLRIKYFLHQKRKARRSTLGMSYRREVEPVWGRWTSDIGRALRR